MTTQAGERLRYRGEDLAMDEFPLESYFDRLGARPEFGGWCTALDRGYEARWEIEGDRLYLTGLSAELEDGSPVSLASFFPSYSGRVFADWYSGTIRAPRGRQVGFDVASDVLLYEEEVVLVVHQGVVVDQQVRPGTRA